jgi:hypothetical protein
MQYVAGQVTSKTAKPIHIPLDFDESLRLAMQVKPPARKSAKTRKKKKAR